MTTPLSERAAGWLGYQAARRPALRRAATLWLTTHLLALAAVSAAPRAAAYPIAAAMSWTGITDSHGVPLGAYYLSTVSTAEAITHAGPPLSIDPASWTGWLASALTTGITHDSIALLLQLQASTYLLLLTLALWLLRFVISSAWLGWLATWFRPLFDTLAHLASDLYLLPICLTLGLAVGGWRILAHNHRGHGWQTMLTTLGIAALATLITRDPVTELAGPHGMLTQARGLGFSVSAAALNNGAITAGNPATQIDGLIAHIADAMVRMPLQLFNFGAVVDNTGNCAEAWSAAILAGQPAGPAHAMTGCGAPQAFTYAAHLDASGFGLGIFYLLAGAVFAFFVLYIAYSYLMVAAAAFLNAVLLIFAAPAALIDGPPRRAALHRLTQFFRHTVLVFAYVTYISFVAVIVLKMAAPGGYAAQVGMTSPVAVLFMVTITALVATGTFRWLKHQLGDHTRAGLTHTVGRSLDAGRQGWARGERARDQVDRRPNSAGRQPDSNTAASAVGASGGPLTGAPRPGRPGPGAVRTTPRAPWNVQSGPPGPSVRRADNPAHPGRPATAVAPAAPTDASAPSSYPPGPAAKSTSRRRGATSPRTESTAHSAATAAGAVAAPEAAAARVIVTSVDRVTAPRVDRSASRTGRTMTSKSTAGQKQPPRPTAPTVPTALSPAARPSPDNSVAEPADPTAEPDTETPGAAVRGR